MQRKKTLSKEGIIFRVTGLLMPTKGTTPLRSRALKSDTPRGNYEGPHWTRFSSRIHYGQRHPMPDSWFQSS